MAISFERHPAWPQIPAAHQERTATTEGALVPERGITGPQPEKRPQSAIRDRIAALFIERLHVEVPSPDADLFETGLLDSLQLVELLCHLEQEFGCRISIEALELDDLRTLDRIAALLTAHGAAAGRAPAGPALPPDHNDLEAVRRGR